MQGKKEHKPFQPTAAGGLKIIIILTELLVLFGSLIYFTLVLYNLHLTAVLTMAVAVMAEVMKGPGMIVGGTMAGDMEIMKIDTEEVIDMAHIITGMTGRECHHSKE